MTRGPVGHWVVRLSALGTMSGAYDGRVVAADLAANGTVSVAGMDGSGSLVGTWHKAGEGRVVLRAVGACGSVEVALELDPDAATCAGRASARSRSRAGGMTEAAAVVVEVDGRRTP